MVKAKKGKKSQLDLDELAMQLQKHMILVNTHHVPQGTGKYVAKGIGETLRFINRISGEYYESDYRKVIAHYNNPLKYD